MRIEEMSEHLAGDARALKFGDLVGPDHAGLHQRSAWARLADADEHEIRLTRDIEHSGNAQLREQLLALSDLEQTFSYCLLDTPIPMFNYVAHVRLLPVTDGDRTFWQWESRFTTRPEDREGITQMVAEQIYQAGFEAVRHHLKEAA